MLGMTRTIYPYLVAPSTQLVKNGDYCIADHSLRVFRSLENEKETNKQKFPMSGSVYGTNIEGKRTHMWCAQTISPNPESGEQTPAEAVADFLLWHGQYKQIVTLLDGSAEDWVDVRQALTERLEAYAKAARRKRRNAEQQQKWYTLMRIEQERTLRAEEED